jgi:molybdate transport system substrate-binding protein
VIPCQFFHAPDVAHHHPSTYEKNTRLAGIRPRNTFVLASAAPVAYREATRAASLVKSFILALILSTAVLRAAEITVFAASSLTDALKQIGSAFEKSSGDTVAFNFAASNTLAMQIKAGAPADLFLSADEAKMNALEKEKLIVPATRRGLLGNSLVIITPLDGLKISEPGDLRNPAIRHFSIGDPKAVPAGIYAMIWLEKEGLWQVIEPKLVPAENVRAALAVVESGNAEAGIVYKTDAATSKKIRIAREIPADEGPEILYPVALLADSRQKDAARKFLAHLSSPQAKRVFEKSGFSVVAK